MPSAVSQQNSPRPTALRRSGGELLSEWSDNTRRHVSVAALRKACPCALCKEKELAAPAAVGKLPVLSIAQTLPLAIDAMQPVGNYAYRIDFSDGHHSGLYPVELIYELSSLAPPVALDGSSADSESAGSSSTDGPATDASP